MKVAVVGHVEWIEFARVDHVPTPGEILQAEETWEEPGGGGAVAAVQLGKLNGGCTFYTVLGEDELGQRSLEQLTGLGLTVRAERTSRPTRRGFVFVDAVGERTITVLGEKLRPSRVRPDDLLDHDAVLFISGDAGALQASRRARTLVAVTRELPTLRQAAVELDALVGSGEDDAERYHPGDLEPPPKLVVTTSGSLGGWTQPGGPYRAAPLPGPVSDAYGCGDSFTAALTFALARGDDAAEAVALAARCGAAVMTGRGPYERQLTGAEV
jgi:ribokinase